jgi:hypothetical protein
MWIVVLAVVAGFGVLTASVWGVVVLLAEVSLRLEDDADENQEDADAEALGYTYRF